MKICITFEVDDTARRAIADYYGDPGKASYATCKTFLVGHVEADLEAVVADSEQRDKTYAVRRRKAPD